MISPLPDFFSQLSLPVSNPQEENIMNPFETGKTYKWVTDIHKQFGGQRQGGISTPNFKEESMNHIDSQEDSGGKTDSISDGACPHNNEDIVYDLHQYLFPGQNRDKEPGH